jgi:hypothetical protein
MHAHRPVVCAISAVRNSLSALHGAQTVRDPCGKVWCAVDIGQSGRCRSADKCIRPVASFAVQLPHSAQDAVLLWIIGVVFAGNLQYGWESFLKPIDCFPYLFSNLQPYQLSPAVARHSPYMLVDQ